MRNAIALLVFSTLAACGAAPSEVTGELAVLAQSANREPPPEVRCDYPRMACGGQCVDVERDNAHCGFCGETCDVGAGLFCSHFRCVSVEDFGFALTPRGPRPYDPSSDGPRPSAR